MAKSPNDLRDPKVTQTNTAGSGGMGKWIGIAIAVLLGLLILAWLLGAFAADDEEAAATDDTIVIEGEAEVVDDATVAVPTE